MSKLPISIHTADQVRAMDRFAIETLGIAGYELMSRAGAAALEVLRARWPKAHQIVVVCGSGNNAGDGYVVARLAMQAGLAVTTIALTPAEILRGDAQIAWQAFASAGGVTSTWSVDSIQKAEVIVDAIFGTGLSRALDDRFCGIVDVINAATAFTLSLDIPSGLHADSGEVLGRAIKSDCTVTFVGLKSGLYFGSGADYVGELYFSDLDLMLDSKTEVQIGSIARRIDETWFARVLPRRSQLAHKGSNGHVLLIGGGKGMAGAIRLAGEAALRVGAGLVTVATRSENVAAVVSDRPELIVRAVENAAEVAQLIQRADIVAIGPGLGQDDWSRALVEVVFACDKPLIIDADALNLLAINPQQKNNWILTPHPGEAGRLLGVDTREIQANRLQAAERLVQRLGGVVVLKGARTVVMQSGSLPEICDRGNPGMATPGMGDVLTGVIAGICAQLGVIDEANWIAARAGVFVHASAGDRAAKSLGKQVERGLIASDLFAQLPGCVNPTGDVCE